MGLKDPHLLKLIRSRTVDSKVSEHCVGVVVIDVAVTLHKLAQKIGLENVTMLGVYNDFMRPVRKWLDKGVLSVLISGEKGIPKIKTATTRERDTESKILPYDDEWAWRNGRLVYVEMQPDPEGPAALFSVRPVITKELIAFNLERVMRTRRLRQGMIDFMFGYCLEREPYKFKPYQSIIVDFTEEAAKGPVIRDALGYSVERARLFANKWKEADWAMPWMFRIIGRVLLHVPILVLSVDGDMLPILSETVRVSMGEQTKLAELKGQVSEGKGSGGAIDAPLQMYLWNGLPGAPVTWMNAMVTQLANRGWTPYDLMLLCHFCGNDYTTKETVFNGMSSETIWKGLEKLAKSYGQQKLKEALTSDAEFGRMRAELQRLADARARYTRDSDWQLARTRIAAGMACWTEASVQSGPSGPHGD